MNQWNRTWGGDLDDRGYGIVINNTDDIFITGSTESYGTFGDVVLLKFNKLEFVQLVKKGLSQDSILEQKQLNLFIFLYLFFLYILKIKLSML